LLDEASIGLEEQIWIW